MRSPPDFKTHVLKWSKRIGPQTAIKKLIVAGLSYSTAHKLAKGLYVYAPQERVIECVKRAMT